MVTYGSISGEVKLLLIYAAIAATAAAAFYGAGWPCFTAAALIALGVTVAGAVIFWVNDKFKVD